MFDIVDKIKENTIIEVYGKQYHALAMAKYVTAADSQKWYVKVMLENHHVLVIAPFDEYISFGFVGKPYPCDFSSPDTIIYDNYIFKKCAEDYQIVKDIIFGDALSIEGEVKFVDYGYQDRVISLGIVMRTSQRADIYGRAISKNDIIVINDLQR